MTTDNKILQEVENRPNFCDPAINNSTEEISSYEKQVKGGIKKKANSVVANSPF
jgi:hypothetical protein